MKEINMLEQTGNLVYVCEYTVLSDYVITSMAKRFLKNGQSPTFKNIFEKVFKFWD